MEHPGEIWQECDYNGRRIGGIEPALVDEDKVRRFNGAAVMLYRYNGADVEFLFQRRSRRLKANPGKWDVSAGGHVNLDEDRVDAIVREAKEEIGATLEADKLELAAIYLRWKVFVDLFFYDWTGKEDDFKFDDEEVEEVKWLKYSEIDGFMENFKWTLIEDKIFFYYLKEWNSKILQKYENI